MTRRFDDDTPAHHESDWTPTGGSTRSRFRDADRTRSHHVVRRDTSQPVYVDADEGALWGDADDFADSDFDVDVEENDTRPAGARRRGAVDPLLLRVGAIIGAAVLVTPVLIALRDPSDAELRSADAEAEATTTTSTPSSRATLSTALTPGLAPRSTIPSPSIAEKRTRTDERLEDAGESDETTDVVQSTERQTTAPAESCAAEYTVVSGDYWVRLAEAADVGLDGLLAVNGATTETALYPGAVICLPAGAQTPEPPPAPTTQAATTEPATTPAPTEPPTTPRPTEPPTTPRPTDPPTTTAPPRPTTSTPPPATSPEAIIREIWPDDIEERALEIARRESNLQPEVYNGFCCYGLFQIYFDANRSFLAGIGITSSDQLRDARTNTFAAYELYKLAGWSPWSQTDPG